MIKFKAGFEFANLQGLAEFSFEDCLDADRVTVFNEDRDRLHGQESSDARDFLRQGYFVSSADFDDVGEKLRLLEALLDDGPAQLDFLPLIDVVPGDHKVSLVTRGLHGLLPP